MAIAAVVASLTIVRQQRQETERKTGDDGQRHEPISPAAVDLDQLRAAGL